MNTKTKFITRTAMLLALVIVVQMAGSYIPAPANSFLVGSLVNACLLTATAMTGIWSGLVISILSPLTSLLFNHAPIASALLPFSPFIAVGNFIFVLSFYLLRKKSKIVGIVSGAILKFGFLLVSITAFLKFLNFPNYAKMLLMLFSWPQLVTALIGGAIALSLIKALSKSIDMD